MKKQLLFGVTAFASIAMVAQNNRQLPANAVAKKVDIAKNNPLEIQNTNIVTPIHTASNKAAAAPYKRVGGSSNAFGVIVAESRCLQYNKEINTVGLIYRQAATWAGIPSYNSGSISFAWSSNNGTGWDSTVLASSTARFHRYPAGTIFNPGGNTTPANAHAVVSGPWHPGADWQGNYYASKQLMVSGTNSNVGATYLDNLALTPGQQKQDFSRLEPQNTTDGATRIMGMIYGNANGTTAATQMWRGASINKATFNAGVFTWSVDSLKPNFKLNTAGDKQAFTGTGNMAWSENGTIGYVIFYGVDANAVAGTSQNSFQPYVYKTINSGGTWARHAALFDFTTICSINNRIFTVQGSTTLAKPFITPGEGGSATVDMNGDLHLFGSLSSAFSDNIDSLGFSVSPNFVSSWNYLVDYKTTSTGWTANVIDSLNAQGPTVAQSNWTGASNTSYDARCQLSRSTDGKFIFYSWADSDTNIVANHISLNPDVYMQGYNVMTDKMTLKKNMSAGKTGVTSVSYFFYTAPKVAEPTSTTFLIPTSIVRNSDLVSTIADNPIDILYIDDNTFNLSDFAYTPSCGGLLGVGVRELSNSVAGLNFYPNPASTNGTIEVMLTESAKMDVVILNNVGQVVSSTTVNGNVGTNKVNISLSDLSAGMYFYQVRVANSKSITQKFVVEK